jgi:hypothetical protein
MKLNLNPEEVAEILTESNILSVKGFQLTEVKWKNYNDAFEVIFEKSPVDQGLTVGTQDKLGRRPPPTPSTPPFVPEYDKDRDNPRDDPLTE